MRSRHSSMLSWRAARSVNAQVDRGSSSITPASDPRATPPIRRMLEVKNMTERDIHLFTSESVTEGHPDKVADQISDAVLDEVLRQDPTGRVACETLVTTGTVFLAGEITTRAYVDFAGVARRVIREI